MTTKTGHDVLRSRIRKQIQKQGSGIYLDVIADLYNDACEVIDDDSVRVKIRIKARMLRECKLV